MKLCGMPALVSTGQWVLESRLRSVRLNLRNTACMLLQDSSAGRLVGVPGTPTMPMIIGCPLSRRDRLMKVLTYVLLCPDG